MSPVRWRSLEPPTRPAHHDRYHSFVVLSAASPLKLPFSLRLPGAHRFLSQGADHLSGPVRPAVTLGLLGAVMLLLVACNDAAGPGATDARSTAGQTSPVVKSAAAASPPSGSDPAAETPTTPSPGPTPYGVRAAAPEGPTPLPTPASSITTTSPADSPAGATRSPKSLRRIPVTSSSTTSAAPSTGISATTLASTPSNAASDGISS